MSVNDIQEMMDRDARINRATRANLLAERLLVRSAAKFREADPIARTAMMNAAFAAAEAFVDEENRRFEAARTSPRRVPRAFSV